MICFLKVAFKEKIEKHISCKRPGIFLRRSPNKLRQNQNFVDKTYGLLFQGDVLRKRAVQTNVLSEKKREKKK